MRFSQLLFVLPALLEEESIRDAAEFPHILRDSSLNLGTLLSDRAE